ncbi:hypothetical protein WG915_08440 [Corynebacterium sp. H128]
MVLLMVDGWSSSYGVACRVLIDVNSRLPPPNFLAGVEDLIAKALG